MECIMDLTPQGGPVMYAGWTEYGLEMIEQEFIKRIRGIELEPRRRLQMSHRGNIYEDIKKSPLPDKIKINLISNAKTRIEEMGFECNPIFKEDIKDGL